MDDWEPLADPRAPANLRRAARAAHARNGADVTRRIGFRFLASLQINTTLAQVAWPYIPISRVLGGVLGSYLELWVAFAIIIPVCYFHMALALVTNPVPVTFPTTPGAILGHGPRLRLFIQRPTDRNYWPWAVYEHCLLVFLRDKQSDAGAEMMRRIFLAALVLVIWTLGVPATPRVTKDVMRMGGWLVLPSVGVAIHAVQMYYMKEKEKEKK